MLRKFLLFSGLFRGVLVLLKFWGAPDIVEFVLGRFSHFNIAIAFWNSKLCGAWTPSFCEFTWIFSKTSTPLAICAKCALSIDKWTVLWYAVSWFLWRKESFTSTHRFSLEKRSVTFLIRRSLKISNTMTEEILRHYEINLSVPSTQILTEYTAYHSQGVEPRGCIHGDGFRSSEV